MAPNTYMDRSLGPSVRIVLHVPLSYYFPLKWVIHFKYLEHYVTDELKDDISVSGDLYR